MRVLPLLALVPAALAVTTVDAQTTSRYRLAEQLGRAAISAIEPVPLTVDAIDGAIIILRHATTVDPDNVELWRVLLRLSDLAERQDLRAEALARLITLSKDDEVVRLLYVNNAIDRRQTVEERIEAYEFLLSEEKQRQLGPEVASRLAADLAYLLDRSGDVDGFSRWLATAVALDPSNRSAVATAAGFFRANVNDAYGEAELLTQLVVADPTAFDTQVVLAQLLLENGAYEAARRIYELASDTYAVSGFSAPSGMLADYAVAQWGTGDAEGALAHVIERQRLLDAQYRWQLRSEQPDLTAIELARRHAPLTSTLATVQAAIHNRLGDDQAGPTLESALAAYRSEIDALKEAEKIDSQEIARLTLEAAWVALWLGADVDKALAFIDAATEWIPGGKLSPAARARFEGWVTLRRGDPTRAVELLQPIADDDPAAELGLAVALRESGSLKTAARRLHALWSREPGTLMGIWARDVLAGMLRRPVPDGPEVARLDDLIDSIPSIVFRLPDEPRLALNMRLKPAKTRFNAYEPILVDLVISNNAPFPLAIDPRGPIRPQVVVELTARISNQPDVGELRPMVVDIDRRLRLEPGERLVIPLDLRRSVLSKVLNRVALRGATLRVKAVANIGMTSQKVIRAGMLGSETEAPVIRIDGVRVNAEWMDDAVAAALQPDSQDDLVTMALLGNLVANLKREGDEMWFADSSQAEVRELSNAAVTALTEGYARLDDASRAWLLVVLPRDGPFDALFGMAQKDPSKTVKITYLLYALTGPEDPMIDAAKRGGDPDVRGVAELMEYAFSRTDVVAKEQ